MSPPIIGLIAIGLSFLAGMIVMGIGLYCEWRWERDKRRAWEQRITGD